ncbi:MAG: DUF4922 domain-containing protein [Bacteroidales bacterium]|nr:DUF4922 domain-containing protein [Bacteroidales bacterium]
MDISQFFSEQMAEWPEARQRYEDLKAAQHKQVSVQGRTYDMIFNPARIRSAVAKVEGGKVDRPCFLCPSSLPKEQRHLEVKAVPSGRMYKVMVNPFPIVDRHFTIVSDQHQRQTLLDNSRQDAFANRVWDMAYLADLLPDYLIFFNGACSGASAPDHLHFQAVPKDLVPLTHWTWAQQQDMGVTSQMPTDVSRSDNMNVICWTEGQDCHWLVIDRRCHRPADYFAEGKGQVLISPASLEYCGLVPMVRQEDFDKVDGAWLERMLCQCRNQEPMLHVGIMEGQQIRFSADERTHALNYLGEDRMLEVMDYGTNRAEKQEIAEYRTSTSPFTLEGVTIGKQFHWQQQEDQTFQGSLQVIAREGTLHAINIVPVEEYLKSVISSEMSATNNLQLLKTHAIISRSWVLRQIGGAVGAGESNEYSVKSKVECSVGESKDTYLRIWDHSDHTLYDVCADDHCQRYQGITRQVSPLVAQAIDETRGMVLVDENGEICDARFSKCCGGKSELFSTCWQDEDFHYLQPVDDPWCDTKDEKVLRLVLNDYDQRTLDFHDWTVAYDQQALTDLINRRMSAEYPDFKPLDLVNDLVPVKRGPSGRIYELQIVANNRTITLGKELLIRKALSESHLYSSDFDVRRETDPATGRTTFTLTGRGWGHGVGLCQIGAANMSQHGFDYEQILTHYFVGAKIEKRY